MKGTIVEIIFAIAGIYSLLTIRKSIRGWIEEYPGSRYNVQEVILKAGLALIFIMLVLKWIFS